MKFHPIVLVLALSLLLAGCESMPERFASVPPRVQIVDGDVSEVHDAAQKAFRRLDLKVIRAPRGRVEAASAINTSETFGDSRQIVARVEVRPAEPGKSTVELTVTEEVGSSSLGGTRQQALQEHSLFQLYFATLEQVLRERASEAAVEKN